MTRTILSFAATALLSAAATGAANAAPSQKPKEIVVIGHDQISPGNKAKTQSLGIRQKSSGPAGLKPRRGSRR